MPIVHGDSQWWQVEDYLVRAREAFSQEIILGVGGILGGGSAQEQGDQSNQKRDENVQCDIERPPPFPPWLGHDGVRCVQAVMQQQVLPPLTQYIARMFLVGT